ncbi:hypothetical protein [Planktothrix agardhii]|nr:hypothetical protein [Planktothrix agardhii]
MKLLIKEGTPEQGTGNYLLPITHYPFVIPIVNHPDKAQDL